LLPEHITPELLFLETKWAALVSYGITADLLHEVLPIDEALAPCTIREHVFTVAERLEQQLGKEQWSFIDSCPAEWHGNAYKALQVGQSIEMDLNAAVATSGHATPRKLLKAVEEFHTYIENNRGFIPNYGERYRHGARISTGFVESTVNQVISKRFCKKQQMRWTKRAVHLLLQMRVKTLNHKFASVFRRWYPDFPVQ
jgi:hypothetical protein